MRACRVRFSAADLRVVRLKLSGHGFRSVRRMQTELDQAYPACPITAHLPMEWQAQAIVWTELWDLIFNKSVLWFCHSANSSKPHSKRLLANRLQRTKFLKLIIHIRNILIWLLLLQIQRLCYAGAVLAQNRQACLAPHHCCVRRDKLGLWSHLEPFASFHSHLSA